MQNLRYALVAYVKSPVGEFVESLRRELHLNLPRFSAHLTLLPPRLLNGSEQSALQTLEQVCGQTEPFEVELGNVATFCPVTPTVYIRVAQGSSQVMDLHNQLNVQALAYREEWPFTPHVTIAKLTTEAEAREVGSRAQQRWEEFRGNRRILLEQLSFVREDQPNNWIDLAPISLRRHAVASR
jgi:2'-5' RNA ligase